MTVDEFVTWATAPGRPSWMVPAPVIVGHLITRHWRQARGLLPIAERLPLPDRQDESAQVIHHGRGDGEVIETRVVTSGALSLEPPGISLDFGRIYG